MKQLFKVASLNLWFGRSQKLLCKINGEKNKEKKKKRNPHTLYTKSYQMHTLLQKQTGPEGK